MIRPYLEDIINNQKAHGEYKIQLVMRIIFVSSINTSELREMHTKSNNIEIMSGTETNDAINEIFDPFLKWYQEGLETKMRASSFTFDRIDLLEYHKIK